MRKHDITIYSSPSCPPCHAVKDFLDEKGVDYTVYDVSQDKEKAREMMQKSGGMAVPTLDIDGEIIVGFQKDQIKRLLNLD